MKNFKYLIISIITLTLSLFTQAALSPSALACGSGSGSSKDLVLSGVGESGTSCNPNGVNNILSTVVNILSIIVGAAAIIVIIVSALKFMTSGGDTQKAASARSTLVYALIGVAVAALAQFLVHFVLYQSTSAT